MRAPTRLTPRLTGECRAAQRGSKFDADSQRALTQWLPLRGMPASLAGSRRSRAISNNRDLRISAIAPQSRGCTQMRTYCGSNDCR